MIDKVRRYIQDNHMIIDGDRIVLGVSGGADSVALLMVLHALMAEWHLKLEVVHVHHGIRAEAEKDVRFVENLCMSLGVTCHVYYENIPALAVQNKRSEEEMGRQKRYEHFAEVAKVTGANKIAVAHHMDDQAETVLFHLIRGTDLAGMRGMLAVSRMPGKEQEQPLEVIRPMLNCRKEEITDYLRAQHITWQEDVTNQDNGYARNRIRNLVIPELAGVNQQAVMHIAAFADQAAAYERFLQKQVQRFRKEQIQIDRNGRIFLDRTRLLEEEPVFAQRVLYELLCQACGRKQDITAVHVAKVYDLLTKQSGRQISLPYGLEAKVSYEKLLIGKCSIEETDVEYAVWNWKELIEHPQKTAVGEGMLYAKVIDFGTWEPDKREILLNRIQNSKNNYTKYFGCDTIKNTLCIRKMQPDDYLIVNRAGNRKTLSRYFIDEKIPVDNRPDWPLVALEDQIIWVIGRRRAEAFPVCKDTQYILELRYEGVSDELSY